MPTYEYKCPACGRFEVEQRITAEPLDACPTCGGPVKRLMPSSVFIRFVGPGFHVNDYPRAGRGSAPPEAAAPGESKAPAAAKPETKPPGQKAPAAES